VGEKLTRRAALACLGSGAVATVLGSRGFDSVNASRGASVSVASDADALLGITGNSDPAVVPTVENNSEQSMDITLNTTEDLKFDVGNDGSWVDTPVDFSLGSGQSEPVNVRFGADCAEASSVPVEFSVDLLDGGSTIGSISLDRQFEVPQSGQVEFTGTAKSPGGSGKYRFDIENVGCFGVELVGIGIDKTTSSDADYVSSGGSVTAGGTTVITQRIDIGNCDLNSSTCYDFNPNVGLSVNDTIEFEFDRFQSQDGNGNSGVSMDGEDLRLTFYYGDGSSANIELCLGSCDF